MKKLTLSAIAVAVASQISATAIAGTSVDAKLKELQNQIDSLKQEMSAKKEDEVSVKWRDNGLSFESNDGYAKISIGGRIHADFAEVDVDSRDFKNEFFADGEESGGEIRRARIYLSGEFNENVIFKAEYDFVDEDDTSDSDSPDFKDVYVGVKDIPYLGTVKVGHFKEPFSLERMTDSNDITFMERASSVSTFAPGYNTGVLIHNSHLDDRMTWAFSVTKESNNHGRNTAKGTAETLRVTGLPYVAEEGRQLLHLGAAYSRRDLDGSDTGGYFGGAEINRINSASSATLAASRGLVDTGSFDADDVDLWGLEAAFMHGPFSAQAEYINADVDTNGTGAADANDPDFDGYYVNLSYFLTGENRPYDQKAGTFGRITPNQNFGKDGWGAWEVAARWSEVDLDDDDTITATGMHGGELESYTLGLNWYLNPNARVMFNYVNAEQDLDNNTSISDTDGDVDAFMTRFQVSFK